MPCERMPRKGFGWAFGALLPIVRCLPGWPTTSANPNGPSADVPDLDLSGSRGADGRLRAVGSATPTTTLTPPRPRCSARYRSPGAGRRHWPPGSVPFAPIAPKAMPRVEVAFGPFAHAPPISVEPAPPSWGCGISQRRTPTGNGGRHLLHLDGGGLALPRPRAGSGHPARRRLRSRKQAENALAGCIDGVHRPFGRHASRGLSKRRPASARDLSARSFAPAGLPATPQRTVRVLARWRATGGCYFLGPS